MSDQEPGCFQLFLEGAACVVFCALLGVIAGYAWALLLGIQ